MSETYSRGVSLAAVRVATTVAAENLDSTAEDTVTADLVVLRRADGVVASAGAVGSSDGSGDECEDSGESRELHFE